MGDRYRDKQVIVRFSEAEKDYLLSLAEIVSPEYTLTDLVRIGTLSLAHRLKVKYPFDVENAPPSSAAGYMATELLLIERIRDMEAESAIEEPT